MNKTTPNFPIIPVTAGAILAFLTTGKERTEAQVPAGHQHNTVTTPLKNYFKEVMDELNNTLDFSANCRKGGKQNAGTHAAYGPASGDEQIYKGYYGI